MMMNTNKEKRLWELFEGNLNHKLILFFALLRIYYSKYEKCYSLIKYIKFKFKKL